MQQNNNRTNKYDITSATLSYRKKTSTTMAHHVTHLSKTDFKIDGHYLYKDSNGNWLSNPPVDNSNVGLTQTITEHIQTLER